MKRAVRIRKDPPPFLILLSTGFTPRTLACSFLRRRNAATPNAPAASRASPMVPGSGVAPPSGRPESGHSDLFRSRTPRLPGSGEAAVVASGKFQLQPSIIEVAAVDRVQREPDESRLAGQKLPGVGTAHPVDAKNLAAQFWPSGPRAGTRGDPRLGLQS